ncbi:hypothetical protein BHM03_00004549 [Ensete ventricosum]|nr:hypothetical protein BHM03_00004549 [Ensete ventricosum]
METSRWHYKFPTRPHLALSVCFGDGGGNVAAHNGGNRAGAGGGRWREGIGGDDGGIGKGEALPWGEEATVGEVRGGDTGPVEEDEEVAGDLRHRGGGGAGLRRSGAQPPRPQGEDQLRVLRCRSGPADRLEDGVPVATGLPGSGVSTERARSVPQASGGGSGERV